MSFQHGKSRTPIYLLLLLGLFSLRTGLIILLSAEKSGKNAVPEVFRDRNYATAASAARMAARGPAGGQAGKAEDPATGGRAPAGRGPSMVGVDEFLKVLDPSIKVEQAAHLITLVSGQLPTQRTVFVMKYE